MAFGRCGLASRIAFISGSISTEIKNTPGLVMPKLQPKKALSSRSTIISFLHREGLTQQLTCIITSPVYYMRPDFSRNIISCHTPPPMPMSNAFLIVFPRYPKCLPSSSRVKACSPSNPRYKSKKDQGSPNIPTIHALLQQSTHRVSFLWYNMLGLNVFAILIKADHVDMVIGSMFKLGLSKFRAMFVSSIFTEYSPHNRFRRIRRQYLITTLDNTDYPGFGGIDMLFGSLKSLCLCRCFEYKPLRGLLNRG